MERRLSLRAKIAIGLLALVATVAYGARVYFVNADYAPRETPVEHYAMGEWVDLSGTFIVSRDQTPDGYAIRVNGARLMTPDEFIREYGVDGEDLIGEDSDETIVCLDYEIRHTGDGQVGIVLFEQRLVAATNDLDLIYDNELWWKEIPVVKDKPGVFALRPDSTMQVAMPFSYKRNPSELATSFESVRIPISQKSFTLRLSNVPVRKVIDVVVG